MNNDILFKKIKKSFIEGDGILEFMEDDLFSKLYPEDILEDEYVIEISANDLPEYEDRGLDVIVPKGTKLSLTLNGIKLSTSVPRLFQQAREASYPELASEVGKIGHLILHSPIMTEDSEDDEPIVSYDEPDAHPDNEYFYLKRNKRDPDLPDTPQNNHNYFYTWEAPPEFFKQELVPEQKQGRGKEFFNKFKNGIEEIDKKTGKIIRYPRLGTIKANKLNKKILTPSSRYIGTELDPETYEVLKSTHGLDASHTPHLLINVDPLRKRSKGFKFVQAPLDQLEKASKPNPDDPNSWYIHKGNWGWREVVDSTRAGLKKDVENMKKLSRRVIYNNKNQPVIAHLLDHIVESYPEYKRTLESIHDRYLNALKTGGSVDLYKDIYDTYKSSLDNLLAFYVSAKTGIRPGENKISNKEEKEDEEEEDNEENAIKNEEKLKGITSFTPRNIELSPEGRSHSVKFRFVQKGKKEARHDTSDPFIHQIYKDRLEHLSKEKLPNLKDIPLLDPNYKYLNDMFSDKKGKLPVNLSKIAKDLQLDPKHNIKRYVIRRLHINTYAANYSLKKGAGLARFLNSKYAGNMPENLPTEFLHDAIENITKDISHYSQHGTINSLKQYLIPHIIGRYLNAGYKAMRVKLMKNQNLSTQELLHKLWHSI